MFSVSGEKKKCTWCALCCGEYQHSTTSDSLATHPTHSATPNQQNFNDREIQTSPTGHHTEYEQSEGKLSVFFYGKVAIPSS